MAHFLLSILINALALLVSAKYIVGFSLNGGIKEFLLAGVILAILNLVVKPIIKLITAPLIIVTLGLFSILINAAILKVTDYFLDFFNIETLAALIFGTVIVGILNALTAIASKIFAKR